MSGTPPQGRVVAPTGQIAVMGLAPRVVVQIKAQQRGLALPSEMEVEVTSTEIAVDSTQDFDHEILIQEMEAIGIHVIGERWEVCG